MNVNEVIERALNEYNDYHAPEAIARCVDIKGNYFVVDFEGYICFSCGFYDYFEDLIYLLLKYGVLSRIVEVMLFDDRARIKYEIYGLRSD